MIIQTLEGNFIQYRMVCAINRNFNKITASLYCGEHHDLYQAITPITFAANEALNIYLATKNITELYVLQEDIVSYMSSL